MWFSIFDFERQKETFLADPKYYKIGFKDMEFNRWVYCRWIIYGIIQGLCILLICFITLNYCPDKSGFVGSFPDEG